MGATSFSLYETIALIKEYEGIYVPAHINRGGYGILQTFGFLPLDIPFPLLEVDKNLSINPQITKGKKVLYSSDAHQLRNILERVSFLERESIEENRVTDILKKQFEQEINK